MAGATIPFVIFVLACGYDPNAVASAPVGEAPIAVAALAFDAYLEGRASGDWSSFLELVSDEVELELPAEPPSIGRLAVRARLAAVAEEWAVSRPPPLVVQAVEAEGDSTFVYRCREQPTEVDGEAASGQLVMRLEVCSGQLCAWRQSGQHENGRLGSQRPERGPL